MDKKVVIIAFLGDIKYDARCLNMAETLNKSNYKVYVLCEQKIDDEDNYSFEVCSINTKKNSGMQRYWNYHCMLQRISQKINPDIFIAGDLFSLAVCAKQKNKCMKIFDSRELYSKLASLVNKPIAQYFWCKYEKLFYKKMDKIIVTAKSDKNYLINRYGKKSIETIYNFPQTPKTIVKLNLRQHFKLPIETKIFIYQGAIQRGRGIDEMIKLLTKFVKCVAIIIGQGCYTRQLKQYSKKLNVNNRVYFLGLIPYNELISITKQANLGFSLIQPISQSYKNALPNKLFEYGLAGIPTISSNFVELKKYTIDYNLGKTVNPSNFNEQIKVVQELLTWKNNKQIKKTVIKNFSWEAQTDKFLKLFEI